MGEVKDSEKVAILSGRYEMVRPGHVATIRREARRFKHLWVFVVYNEKNAYPISWSHEMLSICTEGMNVTIVLDPRHFGRITKEDLQWLPEYDVFLSANPEVTAHLRGLGVNVEDIERTPGYSCTEIKERQYSFYNFKPVAGYQINKEPVNYDHLRIKGV